MSIDTSLASPTSPASAPSLFDPLQVVFDAERATRNAAIRRELDAQPAKARTVADIEEDVRRYTEQQKAPAVIHCLPWLFAVQAKLAASETELAAVTGDAR